MSDYVKCRVSLMLLVLFLIPALYASAEDDFELEGSWAGKLDTGNGQLRFIVHISVDSEGGFSATADSPDQGATGLKVDQVDFNFPELKLVFKNLGAEYVGVYDSETGSFSGDFMQRGAKLSLILKKTEAEVKGPDRPQEPKLPLSYVTEDVTFFNEEAAITLAGTLTKPKGEGPFAAAVLVSGSGPQDRDETLMNHKPFLVIADHLTRKGMLVLRFDDRGFGESEGVFATATTLDHASDALAATRYLLSRDEVEKKKVGVIGHSEGGMIAPIVATRNEEVAFIVLLAGPGVNGRDILVEQSSLMAAVSGATSAEVELNAKVLSTVLDAVIESESMENIDEIVNARLDKLEAEIEEAQMPQFEFIRKAAGSQLEQLTSPWMKFLLSYEPIPVLEQLKCAILVLNGEKDLQVPAAQNLPVIEAALKNSGHKEFKIMELPGLNHLFQTCETGSPAEYAVITETFSPNALDAISDWLLETLK
jgi:fermentation-respiration switch protein FrsA (DUF1100 family)